MDVGETEITAGVAVGELFVVEAEEVKNGGVEVVDVNDFFDGSEAEIIGGAVNISSFDTTAGEHHGESVGVVIAT